MRIDLHCHTNASNGGLSPSQLLARASAQQLSLLAITDHDTMAGYLAVRDQSTELQLISGVELSCTWGKYLIHVLGLGCDPVHPVITSGLQAQQQARRERGKLIAAALSKRGMADCYPRAKALSGDAELGRPHFAQAMVELGHVSSVQQAFKRYLGSGKAGDIQLTWPSLATVIDWINASGGVAVLAHPFHYPLSATKRRGLIADFSTAGGGALEVLSGKQDKSQTDQLVRYCEQFDLHASAGSDFHHPDTGWCELGCQGPLPPGCRPVWELLSL